MAKKTFDIPEFTYFEQKNHYSGSAMKKFNYKIWYGEKFTVKVWYGVNCYSCTNPEEIVAEKEFEFIPESLNAIDEFLVSEAEKFKNSEFYEKTDEENSPLG